MRIPEMRCRYLFQYYDKSLKNTLKLYRITCFSEYLLKEWWLFYMQQCVMHELLAS